MIYPSPICKGLRATGPYPPNVNGSRDAHPKFGVGLVYLDFSLENPYVSDITPLNKFTLSDPDFGPYKAASGWSEIPGQSGTGEREKLAVQTHVGEGAECAEIAIFDVEDCVSGTGNWKESSTGARRWPGSSASRPR